jgi:hypothetical protein
MNNINEMIPANLGEALAFLGKGEFLPIETAPKYKDRQILAIGINHGSNSYKFMYDHHHIIWRETDAFDGYWEPLDNLPSIFKGFTPKYWFKFEQPEIKEEGPRSSLDKVIQEIKELGFSEQRWAWIDALEEIKNDPRKLFKEINVKPETKNASQSIFNYGHITSTRTEIENDGSLTVIPNFWVYNHD